MTSRLTLREKASSSPMVKTATEQGITVVVITHQMSVVEEICDHVAILDGGVVVEQGPAKEIFTAPREERTRAFLRLVEDK